MAPPSKIGDATRARATAQAALLKSQVPWTENGGRPSRQGGLWTEWAQRLSVPLAVVAWYLLGVTSITTTKLLLTDPFRHHHHRESHFYHHHQEASPKHLTGVDTKLYVGGVSPLWLTFQQFGIGVSMLGLIRRWQQRQWQRNMGVGGAVNDSGGLSPSSKSPVSMDLLLAGVFFSLGFLTTNFSFQRGDASFVETVKAAEPLTSALTAVFWGIETLSIAQVSSLGAIVAGVIISTLGHTGGKSQTIVAAATETVVGGASTSKSAVLETAQTCYIVLASNLCFSFRGTYQKLFRATPAGGREVVSDVVLQLKMQQIGLTLFIIPVLLLDSANILARVWEIPSDVGLFQSGIRYIGISIVNGVAFTSYNLASTFVLTRVSVVHHATLNCIRRLFAIVVTSIAFGVPISLLSGFGILVSIGGFAAFTHYKLKKQREPRPISSLLPMSAV